MTEWRGRCPRCSFPRELCLCAEVRPAATRVAITVVRHQAELSKTSNTARWAALALPGLTLLDYAATPAPFDASALRLDGACLLFPAPNETPLPEPLPARLVLCDGTWQQARRMLQRIPGLTGLPRLSLPAPGRDTRRLRRPLVAEGMSTLEALAAALMLFGEPAPAQELLRVNELALSRMVKLRGAHALR